MLDNVVEINGLPLSTQRQEILRKRRHGMGFLGLGSTLTLLGVRYGSPESVQFTEDVARAVLMIEPWGDAAIDAHWRLIRTGTDEEKARAFAAFERFGPRAVRLIGELKTKAKRADVTAIRMLGMIGHPAESAIPVLEDWLKWGTRLSGDQGPIVVEQVTIALARIRG